MKYLMDKAVDVRAIKIDDLEGWITPLIILYGYFYEAQKWPNVIWRVQGTEHVFSIDLRTITQHHGLKFEDHFKLTLTTFREDLIEWIKSGLTEEWMIKYYNQFNRFILK